MTAAITFDHCVIHVGDWERSRDFYCRVLGAEAVPIGVGYAFRFVGVQLNCHGPDQIGHPRAALPVMPGGSDLCFEWHGPISGAIAYLAANGVAVELGPIERFGAKGKGSSVYFRDPDGSLMELISYADQGH
jgi:catechol 2,3-dioxygenase-like lactoylglutathione lyase family enzyme